MHFGFTLDSWDTDLWNIDLLDTNLDLLDADIPSKHLQTSCKLQTSWTCLEDQQMLAGKIDWTHLFLVIVVVRILQSDWSRVFSEPT